MRDGLAMTVAVATVLGARMGLPAGSVPVALGTGAILGVAAFLGRRTWLLVPAALLLAGGLAARAEAGLAGVPDRFDGVVQVVSVSDRPRVGVTARVRAGSHQLELFPPAGQVDLVRNAPPGRRLVVAGTVRPVDPHQAIQRGSHVAGRLRAHRVEPGPPPGMLWRLVGGVRGAVRGLADALPPDQRGLFEGFVLGDATAQSDVQQADFRATGLTHLFVTSGEHVAFVLLLFSPLVARMGPRTRAVSTVLVCGAYAMVTGLQPSVLRAATMAVVATTAAGFGRPVRSWRSLAFAVTLLVLIDPFLTRSVAFGLSVGACTGIVALAQPLVRVLPGPRWLRRPFAVTIAAQIGVAPILVGFPGGMPVAAIPANVLAVPPAGGIMILGLPALALAATGLPGTAWLVWIPRLLLGWVETVARTMASLPLGHLGPIAVAVAVCGVVLAVVGGPDRSRRIRRVGHLTALAALCLPMISGSPGLADRGVVVIRRDATTVVVLTGSVPTGELLTTLAGARVGHLDAVVVPRGDRGDAQMLEAIAHRHRIGTVITPAPIDDLDLAQTVADGDGSVVVGAVVLRVVAAGPPLSVYAEPP